MMKLFIDGDGCNAHARAFALRLTSRNIFIEIVSNVSISTASDRIETSHYTATVVSADSDAVDDYIVEHIAEGDALITRDLVFAKRALAKGAWVVSDYGEQYFLETIDARMVSSHARANIRMTETANTASKKNAQKKAKQLRERTQKLVAFFDAWIVHRKNSQKD